MKTVYTSPNTSSFISKLLAKLAAMNVNITNITLESSGHNTLTFRIDGNTFTLEAPVKLESELVEWMGNGRKNWRALNAFAQTIAEARISYDVEETEWAIEMMAEDFESAPADDEVTFAYEMYANYRAVIANLFHYFPQHTAMYDKYIALVAKHMPDMNPTNPAASAFDINSEYPSYVAHKPR